MLIYETLSADGVSRAVHLDVGPAGLELRIDAMRAAVPARIIVALMHRYGRAVEDGVDTQGGDELRLDASTVLRRFRFRAGVDVLGRDYLALVEGDDEPIVAMATTIAGALEHLANARA